MMAASRLTAAGTAAVTRLTLLVVTTIAGKAITAAWNSLSRKRAYTISRRAPHATHTGTYLLSVAEVIDDYPASPATGAVVTVGGSTTGAIERTGRCGTGFVVELDEDREYLIDLEGWRTDGGTLEDPYLLGIYDLDGELLPGTANDDGGEGLNSRLAFEAPYTGVLLHRCRRPMRITPGTIPWESWNWYRLRIGGGPGLISKVNSKLSIDTIREKDYVGYGLE